MEIVEDYLSGKVFQENLVVLGWTRMKGARRFYAILCKVCEQDPELFGEGIFETTKDSLVRKSYTPCGCGKAYRYTKEQYEILIRRKAEILGYKFNGWVEDFKNGASKINMICEEGSWTPRANQFIARGVNRYNRGKARLDDNIIIEKFFSTGAFHPDTKFSRERLYNKWYWKVDCPVCGESGLSQSQHLQRGCRPCSCGNYKQKYSYVHAIYDGDLIVALKFGITRSKDMRIKYQARETSFSIVKMGLWEYDEKHNCVSAERCCMATLDTGVLSKQDFGDGYTETTHVFNLDKIIEIYENYGGMRIE